MKSTYFHYICKELYAEQASVKDLITKYGTPLYIYSKNAIKQNWQTFDDAFEHYPHRIAYAVKANDNLHVLKLMAELGANFDIVSLGELKRVLFVGAAAERIIFSGVGKRADEIHEALIAGIGCFNVESMNELQRIQRIAEKLNKIAPIAFRINPDIDANTHPYISTGLKENKFGIPMNEALHYFQHAQTLSHIKIVGVACHIGSQLLTLDPFSAMCQKIIQLVEKLKTMDIHLQHIDVGGGLGVAYDEKHQPPPISEYVKNLLVHLSQLTHTIFIEPGRALIADAGILVTRVEYLKTTHEKNFAIVDAGMNDFLRPALYQTIHAIVSVQQRADHEIKLYDVVGPVCESADCFAKNYPLQIEEGDALALMTVGAYGRILASHYNSRPRPAEIMVDGSEAKIICARETIADLYHKELTDEHFNTEKNQHHKIKFSKMHGAGNDFVVIDGVTQHVKLSANKIMQLADRYAGIGFDQLLLIEQSDDVNADFNYRIFNADGSEVGQCGNGVRCVTKFLLDKKLCTQKLIVFKTITRYIHVVIDENNMISADMGIPQFVPQLIPAAFTTEALIYDLNINNMNYQFSLINMGNPHAVFIVDDVQQAAVHEIGTQLQQHSVFPESVNVGFMQIIDRDTIKLRVFERGAGETLACGSGACAAVVAGIQQAKLNHEVKVHLRGGVVTVHWQGQSQDHVFLIGDAHIVYEGEFEN